MENFKYGDEVVQKSQRYIDALIDSAHSSIQLPEDMFNGMLQELKKQETDGLQFTESLYAIEASKPCAEIIDKLKPISFKLDTTLFAITPQGYTHEEPS